jgi:hypothetical protein
VLGGFDPDDSAFLSPVFENDLVTIYRVLEPES